MASYAPDNPRLAFNYDYVANTPVYDSDANDNYALEGFTEEAIDIEGYYDDGYVYAGWICR